MKRANEAGFTLIELSLVLGGLTLISSLLLPAVQADRNKNMQCTPGTAQCEMRVGQGTAPR